MHAGAVDGWHAVTDGAGGDGTPAEIEAGLRLLARLVSRMWTRCDRCGRPATRERTPQDRDAEDFPRVFRCDEHAQGLVTHPVAWGAEDMRALSALAFPPDAGTLTSAEADELRRQGDG